MPVLQLLHVQLDDYNTYLIFLQMRCLRKAYSKYLPIEVAPVSSKVHDISTIT